MRHRRGLFLAILLLADMLPPRGRRTPTALVMQPSSLASSTSRLGRVSQAASRSATSTALPYQHDRRVISRALQLLLFDEVVDDLRARTQRPSCRTRRRSGPPADRSRPLNAHLLQRACSTRRFFSTQYAASSWARHSARSSVTCCHSQSAVAANHHGLGAFQLGRRCPQPAATFRIRFLHSHAPCSCFTCTSSTVRE